MVRFGSKTRVVLAIAVLGLVGASLARLGGRAEPRARSEAKTALAEGRLADADQILTRWLATDPGAVEAHLLRGRIALEQKRVADAATELQRALAPGGSPAAAAVLLRALIAAAVGRTEEAEPELSRAFDAPGPPDRLVDEALAKIRIEAFDLGRATRVLDRWVRDFPRDPKPHLWRAEIHGRTGGDSGAVASDYRAALQRDPNLAEARLKLAAELARQHQSAAALVEFDAYLAQRPADASAHLGAARIRNELGDEEGVARHLDQALKLAPDDPEVYRVQAEAASRRGDWLPMLGALDRALALDPDDLTTRYQRGVVLGQLGRVEEARAEQSTAARLRADLARLNAARRRLVEAPHDRGSQLEIARWMFAHAHAAEGTRWAEKILREWPDDPAASRLLADHYRRSGNLGLANFYQLHAGPDPAVQLPKSEDR